MNALVVGVWSAISLSSANICWWPADGACNPASAAADALVWPAAVDCAAAEETRFGRGPNTPAEITAPSTNRRPTLRALESCRRPLRVWPPVRPPFFSPAHGQRSLRLRWTAIVLRRAPDRTNLVGRETAVRGVDRRLTRVAASVYGRFIRYHTLTLVCYGGKPKRVNEFETPTGHLERRARTRPRCYLAGVNSQSIRTALQPLLGVAHLSKSAVSRVVNRLKTSALIPCLVVSFVLCSCEPVQVTVDFLNLPYPALEPEHNREAVLPVEDPEIGREGGPGAPLGRRRRTDPALTRGGGFRIRC